MKIRRHLLIACLFGLLPMASQAAAASPVDHIIVKWRGADAATASVSTDRVRNLAGRMGQTLTHRKAIGGGMAVLQLGTAQQGATLAATLHALRADPDVELAEPDQWMTIQAYTPSDPLFSGGISYGDATHPVQFYESQWYLKSAQIAAIRADAAWDLSKGGASAATSPVVIAVIDTGVRPEHPDLAGKLLPGYDFVSNITIANDGTGWDDDPTDPGDFVTAADVIALAASGYTCTASSSTWHGTRVAGLVAANTDNALGMAGTGFNVRVVPVRVLGKCGGLASDVIAGMYWAAGLAPPPPLLLSTSLPVNAHPAQILNLSLGSAGACSATYAAAVNDITAHGVLVVVAAGNDGTRVGNPASCAGALAVAGIRHVGTKVGYSNLGPEVGIAAPAGNCVFVTAVTDPCVYSLTTITNAGTQEPGASIYSDSLQQPTFGTSFSSPLVAGVAGLMKAANPALTPALLISRIKEGARTFPASSADASTQPPACQLPTETSKQETECICNTQVCGAGMLDARTAVLSALRPIAYAQVTGTVATGRQLTLDASQTVAAAGRSLASFLWTVESTSGGATPPIISNSGRAVATVLSPAVGNYSLRVTATDNFGSSDSAIVTVTATDAATTTTSPPPAASSGGGGSLSITFLLLAAALLLARRLQRPATAHC